MRFLTAVRSQLVPQSSRVVRRTSFIGSTGAVGPLFQEYLSNTSQSSRHNTSRHCYLLPDLLSFP